MNYFSLTFVHTYNGTFSGYGGGERITDGAYGYEAVNATYHFAPDKILLATEGCSCPNVAIGNDWAWLRAERLAHDIIYDLNAYAQGWIDWNLLVDAQGGPNHIRNYCDASIIVNSNHSDIILQPKLFYFAHFSKYVTPQSTRIHSMVVGNFHFAETDPLVYAAIELGAYYCEKSSRQVWNYNQELKTIELLHWTQNRTVKLCIGSGDSNRNFLTLRDCTNLKAANNTAANAAPVLLFEIANGSLRDIASGLCVSLAKDVRESGALLELTSCAFNADPAEIKIHQIFSFEPLTSELQVLYMEDFPLCVTAGWPFLSAVAFSRSEADSVLFASNEPVKDFREDYSNVPSGDSGVRETVLIVVNEASIATSIVLRDKESGKYHRSGSDDSLGFVIAAHAIQTVLY